MAVTTFGIVYSVAQSVCRRIYTGIGDDSELVAIQQELPSGEAMLILPLAQVTGDKNVANALIAQSTGVPTTSDRCAYIAGPLPNEIILKSNPAVVAGVVLGDPNVTDANGNPTDVPPNATIVAFDDLVTPGDFWNGTDLLRNYAVVNTATGIVEQTTLLALDNPVSPTQGAILVGNAANALQTGSVAFTPSQTSGAPSKGAATP
jgi:hypothetical protein